MSKNLENKEIKKTPIENYRKMTLKHQAIKDSLILQNDTFRL